MKKVKRLMATACLFLGCANLWAQETVQATPGDTLTLPDRWDLQTCIEYAKAHNITIRRNRINAESTAEDVKTAKAEWFPALSGSVSQRVVNRPNTNNGTIISGDNITTSQSKTSYNGSYGIDANWTLFNGGSRVNGIRQQKLNERIARLAITESENSIQENILQLYMQILYAAEAVKVNEGTLEVSRATYERGRQLMEAGSLSRADLAQLEAQVSSDNYQVVTAKATLQDYRLQLKQLLELDGAYEMVLDMPQLEDVDVLTPLPAKEDVYRMALALRPEIESGKLNIEAADLGIKVARAGYIPSISLTAGIGSTNANGNDFTFTEQIKQNWNNSLGVTLSIPLFDRRQTKSAVNKAKLQKQTSQLDLLDRQKELYRTIESYWLDARSAQQQYDAAAQQVKSAQASYDLVSEQFNAGMKNTVDLLTEKNNLLNAQQSLLQAKYMALLNAGLLRFYQGESPQLN